MLSETFFEKILIWILSKGVKIFFIFIFAFLINSFLKSLLKKIILGKIKNRISNEKKKKRAQTLISVLGGTLRFLIYVVAILTALPEFGINTGPILTSMGLLGLALSMAAKDTISDFISGLFIILEGQFFVGDKIKIGNIEGEVVEFNLRRTIIKDEKNFLHYIPNSQIKILAKKLK